MCHAVRAPGSKVTAAPAARAGDGAVNNGSMRTVPVNQSAGPLPEGFEPGARTAWHTHPLGQTLVVLSGAGLVQREGGPVEPIRPGDIVWFAPGEKHWHGAPPATAMTHIAIQEVLDGKAVEWLEQVSDAQYGGQLAAH